MKLFIFQNDHLFTFQNIDIKEMKLKYFKICHDKILGVTVFHFLQTSSSIMLLVSGICERKYLLLHCKSDLMTHETFEIFIVKSIDYDSMST